MKKLPTTEKKEPWKFQNSFDKSKLIGQKFHHLTVMSYSHRTHDGKRTSHFWNCKCVCGNSKAVNNTHLVHGSTKSCGCKKYSHEWYQHRMNTPERIKEIISSIKPTENGCLEWPLTLNDKGYGKITYLNKTCETHRVAWRITKGEIPKGQVVRHLCNNKKCVNIEHLALGTYQDNTNDAKKAGVLVTGEESPNAKLTKEIVRHMRQHESHLGTTFLGRKYGVDNKTIERALKYKTWRNI